MQNSKKTLTILEGETLITNNGNDLETHGLQSCVSVVICGKNHRGIGHFSSPLESSKKTEEMIRAMTNPEGTRKEQLKDLKLSIIHLDDNPISNSSIANAHGCLHGMMKFGIAKANIEFIKDPRLVDDSLYGSVLLAAGESSPKVTTIREEELPGKILQAVESYGDKEQRMRNFQKTQMSTDNTPVRISELSNVQKGRFRELKENLGMRDAESCVIM